MTACIDQNDRKESVRAEEEKGGIPSMVKAHCLKPEIVHRTLIRSKLAHPSCKGRIWPEVAARVLSSLRNILV